MNEWMKEWPEGPGRRPMKKILFFFFLHAEIKKIKNKNCDFSHLKSFGDAKGTISWVRSSSGTQPARQNTGTSTAGTRQPTAGGSKPSTSPRRPSTEVSLPPPPLNFSSPDPIFYWLSSFCFVSPSASMGMIRDDVRASSCSPICGWLISGNIFDQETNVDGEIIKSGR